jgi:hypothetical protein
MRELAHYLLDSGILSKESLEEARNAKAVYGGRLGTNLVQLGFFQLEELAVHLSRCLGVPLPPAEWLDEPDESALKLIPLPLVRRCKALPLKLEKKRIHVVMLDPLDPQQLDFLATAAAREVTPYVLPELRLLYLLEYHLGIDRHPRFVNITTRAVRLDVQEPQPCPPSTDDGAEPAAPPAKETSDAFELLLEDVVPETMASEPPRPAAGLTITSTQASDIEAQLFTAPDRDAVVDVALHLASAHCQVVAMFLVAKGVVRGFRVRGEGLGGPLSQIQIPVATRSILAQPVLTWQPFRGAPPRDGIDGRLLDTLGRSDAQEVLVLPVPLRDRVVSLLYADNGDAPLAETSVAALTAIAPLLSQAYERLLLRRRG